MGAALVPVWRSYSGMPDAGLTCFTLFRARWKGFPKWIRLYHMFWGGWTFPFPWQGIWKDARPSETRGDPGGNDMLLGRWYWFSRL